MQFKEKITMNISTAPKLETKERLFVPVIVSTNPTPVTKEIDLTFVQFAQRKHAAATYINQVTRKRELKREHKIVRKEKFKNKVLEVLSWTIFSVVLSLAFFGIGLLGIMF